VFISCNFIAGVEPADASLLGWDFDVFDLLNGPVRDETGNGIRRIEVLIEGIQSKTPQEAER